MWGKFVALGYISTAECPKCGRTCHFPDWEFDFPKNKFTFHCNWCDIDFSVWE